MSIKDIAKEANVSVASVSRVLNNSLAVKESTRLKIQEVIDKNNYKPNELARGLFTKRTKTIGVILPDITNHFFAKIFLEIEKAIIEYGQSAFLCNTLSDYSLEDFYTQRLSEKQVDGFVLLGGHANETKTNSEYINLLKREVAPTPVVVINGKLDNYSGNYASVSSDEYEAMFQALEYLTSLGHKKIAFLGGVKGIMSTDLKIKALKDAKTQFDYTMKKEWVIFSSYSYLGGVEAMNKLLNSKEMPTAIIAINDEVAAGAINTCIGKGYKVPDDFSILGFDNSFISITTLPTITTISHQYKQLGQKAVEFVNDMINEKPIGDNNHISLNMSVIKRDSCKMIK